jgi:hypothetical protein
LLYFLIAAALPLKDLFKEKHTQVKTRFSVKVERYPVTDSVTGSSSGLVAWLIGVTNVISLLLVWGWLAHWVLLVGEISVE